MPSRSTSSNEHSTRRSCQAMATLRRDLRTSPTGVKPSASSSPPQAPAEASPRSSGESISRRVVGGGRQPTPGLLTRGPSAKLEEWLLAAEYVINAGNSQVMLCERGIRTFEEYVRNTLPLAVVPELRERTHLPVLVDPSHGTGHSHLVPAMCRAAIAAGADGLLLEVHPDPEHALSDGAQSITPAAFAETVSLLKRIAQAVGREL